MTDLERERVARDVSRHVASQGYVFAVAVAAVLLLFALLELGSGRSTAPPAVTQTEPAAVFPPTR